MSRSSSGALLPFLFLGRVPLLQKERYPYSNLSTGPRQSLDPPRFGVFDPIFWFVLGPLIFLVEGDA